MIVLNGTTESLQAVLSAAPATTQPTAIACYADTPGAGAVGDNAAALNGTTAVTLVAAPLADVQRVVRTVSIYNGDTAEVTVELSKLVSATAYTLVKITLAAGYTLTYTQDGWRVTDTSGASVASGGGGGLSDAPSDGTLYGRENGAWVAVTGGSSTALVGINDQTGTTYTLVLGDAGKDVRCTNASAVALTIPANSSVAFPIGTWLLFSQGGAGAVTATAGSGVTLNAASGVATVAQYDVRGLEKVGTDTWRAI